MQCGCPILRFLQLQFRNFVLAIPQLIRWSATLWNCDLKLWMTIFNNFYVQQKHISFSQRLLNRNVHVRQHYLVSERTIYSIGPKTAPLAPKIIFFLLPRYVIIRSSCAIFALFRTYLTLLLKFFLSL